MRRAACACSARANTGLSSMPSRTHSPTPTSTALATNGTRQPQAANCPAATDVEAIRKTRFESTMPAGSPSATTLPKKPRRPSGACSTDISTAPPHSPPRANPCTKRSTTSRTGAHTPICAYVGSSPIASVALPMSSSDHTSMNLRPSRSP